MRRKLSFVCGAFLALMVCCTPAGSDQSDLVGSWKIVSAKSDLEFADALATGSSVVIDETWFTLVWPSEKGQSSYRYRVHAKDGLKCIDLTMRNGDIIEGIYRINNNALEMLFADTPKAQRPSAFEASGGCSLLVMRRKASPHE